MSSHSPMPLSRRLLGFALLPAIAAVSPLLVLPAVSRTAGPDGWASAIAGESVGTFAAIAIAYGWTTIGPSLVAIAPDTATRGRLYRDALVVRAVTGIVALPILAAICWWVSSPGFEWLAVLMGVQGALIALSFTWFAVGVGDPRAIMIYDAVPRLLVAVVAMLAIVQFGVVELYPALGITVTLVGTTLYTVRLLRHYPSDWPTARELPALFRVGAPVALNDAALGAYSSVPTPLVNIVTPGVPAAGFASADKLLKLGQFLPLTLANALQTWTAEVPGAARARRLRIALVAHGGFGVLGWLVLGLLGPWVSLVLFGAEAATTMPVCFALGLAFAMYSLRTSMTRHLIFPTGGAHAVMVATLTATVVGVPAMIGLASLIGPLGAALGYAFTETVATGILIPRSIRALNRVAAEEPA